MKEHFVNLRRLQEIDNEIKSLRARLSDLPDRIKEIQKKTEAARRTLEEKKQLLHESKKQYKLAEVELRNIEEKISTYSVQLYSAKDNVQYKALIKEIETQKKLKGEIEDRIIMLLEENEKLEREIQELEKAAERTAADAQIKISTLEEERKELEKAVAEREMLRNQIAQLLPSDLLQRYERIRSSKGGLAVTNTENERCNGCLSPIPPQRVLEIERQDKLYLCEACGRILLPVEKKVPPAN